MTNGILHITTHTGKMEGIHSINVTCENDFCSIMQDTPGSICEKCYAARLEKIRPTLHQNLVENAEKLGGRILHEHELPWFPPKWIVRFNSFGELLNETHLMNLIMIAKKNPEVTFALWTKRTMLIETAARKGLLPMENIVLIQSARMLDEKPLPEMRHPFDYLYVVRSTDDSCGDRCVYCRRCYQKPDSGDDRVIYQKKH